jgi:Tfp pilus assembly protein PilX
MKFFQTLLERIRIGMLRNQNGLILIAALTLLAALTLVGATAFLVSSSNVKVGGNFRTNQTALQVAMAGVERAREILRQANATSANTASFSEELAARVGSNGQLNDPLSTTDDLNVITSNTSSASMTVGTSTVSYLVYLTNDSYDPNGWLSTTDANKRALLTSIATGQNNSKAIVQAVVEVFPMVSSPAAIYTKGDVTGNGQSLTVSGNDACNSGTNLGSIYAKGDWDPNGNPTLSGNPATPTENGTLDLDIAGMISTLKASANVTLTQDQNNTTYGSSTNYQIVYSNTSSPNNVNGLNLSNITGWGILLVDGDLELGGGFNWNGIILATGAVRLNGGGGPNAVNIAGQLLSGTSTVTDISLNGSNNITYNSCYVKNATAQAPLKVLSWKQTF